METAPILPRIAEVLKRHGLDAILVGDAAAALRGSSVAALSIRFEYRRTMDVQERLAEIAAELGGAITRPLVNSQLLRITLPTGLSVGFMPILRRRAWSECSLKVVSIRTAVASRPSRRIDGDMIRRWQALPPEKRTNFLRVRTGLRGSCL